MAEFALEGGRLDCAEATAVVGARPTSFRREFEDVDGRRDGCDRWALAVGSETVEPGDVMEQLVALQSVLEGSAEAIAAYCDANAVTASFRVTVDSETEAHPVIGLTHGFCAFAARLGAGVGFELRTRPHLWRGVEPGGDSPAQGDDSGDLERLANAEVYQMLRSGRLIESRRPPEMALGPVRRPERVVVAAGRAADSTEDALRFLKWGLAAGLAEAEVGAGEWAAHRSLADGAHDLRRGDGARFLFTESDAGPCAAVAAARTRVGIAIELACRVFSPELISRFAPDEQDYVRGGAGDAGRTADGEAGRVDGLSGDGRWPACPPAANARALEVWAKKQAWTVWSGSWPQEGLRGFSVTGSRAHGERFFRIPLPPEAGLIGWICTGDRTVTGVDATWAGEAAS
ncbi:MAG: DUF4279 domain-containing protein [Bifidobacteriaceae bacterium]|nr:DUF4279 domain-containing protein [Bifidobacteriaceae bacterium]